MGDVVTSKEKRCGKNTVPIPNLVVVSNPFSKKRVELTLILLEQLYRKYCSLYKK